MLDARILPAGRALLAIALGLTITFTTAHTAAFGLIVFGVYAAANGLWMGAMSFLRSAPTEARVPIRAHAIVSLVAGALALAVPAGGMAYFVWILSGWAIVVGGLELVTGLRHRAHHRAHADAVITGGLTLLLGATALAIPPDIVDRFSGDKGVEGVLTSPIIVIGLLGAWGIVTGVQIAIAAASPRESSSAEVTSSEARS